MDSPRDVYHCNDFYCNHPDHDDGCPCDCHSDSPQQSDDDQAA